MVTSFCSESVYDEKGNLLEEKPADSLDAAARKKISTVRNKLEDLIQRAKQSDEGMDFLVASVLSIEEPLNQMVPNAVKHTRQEEYEAFIGCTFLLKLTYTRQMMLVWLGDVKNKKRKGNEWGKTKGEEQRSQGQGCSLVQDMQPNRFS